MWLKNIKWWKKLLIIIILCPAPKKIWIQMRNGFSIIIYYKRKSAHGSQQVSSPMNKYRLSTPVSYQGQPPLIMYYTFYFSHSLLSNPGNTHPSLPQQILKQLEEKTTSHEEFWREDNSTKTLFSCLKNVIYLLSALHGSCVQ